MTSTLLFLVLSFFSDPAEIAKTNQLKRAAEKAFQSGNYEQAALTYSQLYDSLGVEDPSIALNMGHAWFALGDSTKARQAYEGVTASTNNQLKSIAYQQLGVLTKNPQTLQQSLAYLKSALKADPTNEGARYDYEVVKKLLEQQQKQEQENKDKNQEDKDQQNEDQQNQDQQQQEQNEKNQEQNQENKDQQQQDQEQKEQEGGEEQKSEEQKQQEQQEGEQKDAKEDEQQQQQMTQKKLEEMNIPEDKARMILEALKNNEIQYLQQQKRKPTQRPASGKPDW